MPYKPFKIFIIDSINDKNSSYIQDSAFAAFLQSSLQDKAEILCAKLESARDWMPAGHIHVQGFGYLQIMFNYEGDLTKELTLTMNQISYKVHEIFSSNLTLALHKALNSDDNNDELNDMFLSLQYTIGQMKYSDIKSELVQTTAELEKNAAEFKERSDLLAHEITAAYKSFLEKVMEAATSSRDDNSVEGDLSLLKDNHDRQLGMISKELEADRTATLAKQRPLRMKAAILGFFADRTAEGYRLPQEKEAQAITSETPTSSSSSPSI